MFFQDFFQLQIFFFIPQIVRQQTAKVDQWSFGFGSSPDIFTVAANSATSSWT